MAIQFNPLIFSGLDLTGGGAAGAAEWREPVANEAALPLVGNSNGEARVTLDTDKIYVWDATSSRWVDTGITAAAFGNAPNANGQTIGVDDSTANIRRRTITLQPADATNPGGVSTTTQSIAGAKTFLDQVKIDEASNQLVLGTTTTTTLTAPNPAANRTVTLPDGGADSSIVITESNQTINGTKTFSSTVITNGGIDVAATVGTDTLTIGGTNADVINVGHSGTTVNVIGTTFNQQVTNVNVEDKNITVNSGGPAGSGATAGIDVEENGSITGYVEVSGDRNSWVLKAPNTAGTATVTPGATGIVIDESSSALLPLNGTRSMTGDLNMGGNDINNATSIDSPSTVGTDLLSVGTVNADAVSIGKAGGAIDLNAETDLNSNKIINLANGTNPNDAVNLSQLTTLQNYADQQIVYVSKNGSDLTGTGGQHKPFLTIQAAINAITDNTASKKYLVRIAPGTYTETLTLKPWVSLQGYNKETVAISIPAATSISLSARGRVWLEGISFTGSGSISIATAALTGSGTVLELRTCAINNTGGFTFTGRGPGQDYVQFRNTDATRAINISGAAVTIYDSTASVSCSLQTGGTSPNTYGELLEVFIKSSYIYGLTVVANSGQTAFFQGFGSTFDGTTTFNGAGLTAYLDAISWPPYPNTFTLLNTPTVEKITKIEATRYNNATSGLAATNGQAAIDELAANVVAHDALVKEPTGFPNTTDSTTSFVDGTRTFTIQPTGVSFDVYVKGKKFTKTTAQNVTIPAFAGNHYIYFNDTGVLASTQTVSSTLFTDNAMVSIIYWNTDTNTHTYFAEERHGLVMDGATHTYLHTVFGSRYLTGLALQNFSVNGDGNSDAHAQFTSDSGTLRDEDLLITLAAQTQISILYRQGALWRRKTADAFPLIYSGTAGYTGPNGLIPYNQFIGGLWQLTEVANNSFVLVHFFGTNDKNNPVIGIQGTSTYNNVTAARIAASTEITSLSGLPFAEFVPIGSVVFETANTYANTPKAVVRSVNGGNYVDFRGTQLYTPAGTATTHSLLSGLSNDDHTQYLLTSGARAMTGDLTLENESGLKLGENTSNGTDTIEIKAPAALSASFTYTLPNALPGSNELALTSDTSGAISYLYVIPAAAGDIKRTSFTALDNQTLPLPITGLAFNNAVTRGFETQITIVRGSTYAEYSLKGIQKGSSWEMSQEYVGDTTGVSFSITNSGQIEYTTTATGNSAALLFRAQTV